MKRSNRFKTILMGVLLSGFGLVCTGHQAVLAQTTTTKTINGEVSGVMSDSISIAYKDDAATGERFEILFMVDQNVQLIGRERIKGFKEGDRVLATYTETVSTDENGNQLKDRQLVSIKLLQSAVVEAAPAADEDSSSEESISGSTLISEQP